MIANLLFEIGTEEIPAQYMPQALKQLKTLLRTKLDENRIKYGTVNSVGTPRRIAVFVEGISTRQSDVDAFVKGPSGKAAYDGEGAPTKALCGFMRSHGILENDILIKQVGGIDYIFAHKTESGKETKEILGSLLPEVICAVNFPKSMRWRDYNIKFARPIRWLVALLGKEIIPFSIEGVSASNVTKGHRTLSDKSIPLECADVYFSRLRDAYIMVDPEDRKESIVKQVTELARSRNGNAIIDDDLLNEIVFLVEYPTALLGSFDKEFLALPREAVITPMKEHQRYFPVADGNGKLQPYFITVRNGNDEFIDTVRTGNERVLHARLKDAQFFYLEDLKGGLENKVEKLTAVVFQDQLGTVYDKVNRILRLAEFIANKLSLTETKISLLKRAAYLCKADLVSGMVNEFDELQGIMGKEYALKSGEALETAEAIYSHYLPRYSGDGIPGDVIGQILSIADKLDSCAGIFGIGIQPTGSQDPYGLRRSCLGILSVIAGSHMHLDLRELVDYSIGLYGDKLTEERCRLYNTMLDFMKQRIRVGLIDSGFRHDIVDSVLCLEPDDINDLNKRVREISEAQMLDTKFSDLLTALTRVFNLSSKASDADVDTHIFENAYEQSLYSVNLRVKEAVEQKIKLRRFHDAVQSLYDLIDPIHAFFENTLVIAENDIIKHNRLSLLQAVATTALQVCDFSKITAL